MKRREMASEMRRKLAVKAAGFILSVLFIFLKATKNNMSCTKLSDKFAPGCHFVVVEDGAKITRYVGNDAEIVIPEYIK